MRELEENEVCIAIERYDFDLKKGNVGIFRVENNKLENYALYSEGGVV